MRKNIEKMDMTRVLPSDCISKIISFTSPRDACRSSLVSSAFKEAADSDVTWESFLPSDSKDIVAKSSFPNLNSLRAKQLYFHLCDHPILLADGNLSFSLTKSGKKCYTIGGKGLSIKEGDIPLHWNWISIPESRFPQVAELNHVGRLEVKGSLNTKLLSPETTYGVFFIFKFGLCRYGFRNRLINYSISDERGLHWALGAVVLYPPIIGIKQREDGWMELSVGELWVENEDVVECRIWETSGDRKEGLVVEGFELRPPRYQ